MWWQSFGTSASALADGPSGVPTLTPGGTSAEGASTSDTRTAASAASPSGTHERSTFGGSVAAPSAVQPVRVAVRSAAVKETSPPAPTVTGSGWLAPVNTVGPSAASGTFSSCVAPQVAVAAVAPWTTLVVSLTDAVAVVAPAEDSWASASGGTLSASATSVGRSCSPALPVAGRVAVTCSVTGQVRSVGRAHS